MKLNSYSFLKQGPGKQHRVWRRQVLHKQESGHRQHQGLRRLHHQRRVSTTGCFAGACCFMPLLVDERAKSNLGVYEKHNICPYSFFSIIMTSLSCGSQPGCMWMYSGQGWQYQVRLSLARARTFTPGVSDEQGDEPG